MLLRAHCYNLILHGNYRGRRTIEYVVEIIRLHSLLMVMTLPAHLQLSPVLLPDGHQYIVPVDDYLMNIYISPGVLLHKQQSTIAGIKFSLLSWDLVIEILARCPRSNGIISWRRSSCKGSAMSCIELHEGVASSCSNSPSDTHNLMQLDSQHVTVDCVIPAVGALRLPPEVLFSTDTTRAWLVLVLY